MLRCLILVACIFTGKNAPVQKQLNDSETDVGRQNNSPDLSGRSVPDGDEYTDHLNTSAETHLDYDENVVEGDIILPSDRSGDMFLWPGKNNAVSVPYDIPESLKNRTVDIIGAFNMISNQTCIRFHKRTTENDYIQFLPGQGCASYVGFKGDAQPIFVDKTCSVGNLCHELMHALGLYHEHTRPDRDSYITVLLKNVISGKQGNFYVRSGPIPDIQYDLQSIMHYGKYFFSLNSNPTILPKDSEVNIGQRRRLSVLDVKHLKVLYNCGEDPTCSLLKSVNVPSMITLKVARRPAPPMMTGPVHGPNVSTNGKLRPF